MNDISPAEVLRQVSEAVPSEIHGDIIIVGSLAAGYLLLGPDQSVGVRTKDVHCILSPRIQAVRSATAIAEKLIGSGWKQDKELYEGRPGDVSTPPDALPIVRLYPPHKAEWFVELLTVPESEKQEGRQFERIEIRTGPDPGYYGLPSFRFLSLTANRPVKTPLGIPCARPEMMALANMLEHPDIKPERMGGLIEGRGIKRSNKDLGRVLAIAWLTPGEILTSWPALWEEALKSCFPTTWRKLAATAGSGIDRLLGSEEDLQEAYHTCIYGLLSSLPPTIEQLRISGKRLVQDAIQPLQARATN